MNKSMIQDRAAGALAGVALGDAMGMPSQTLTRAAIHQAYGRITDFVAPMPHRSQMTPNRRFYWPICLFKANSPMRHGPRPC